MAVTCSAGFCVENARLAATVPLAQAANDCKTSTCDGNGGRISTVDPSDHPKGSTCIPYVCQGVTPTPTIMSGATCDSGGGVANGICDAAGACIPATCADTVKNNDETATDCGGSCAPCADGLACAGGTDCTSGVCLAKLCVAPTCTDGVQNGAEAGVDCGGACPTACADGAACKAASDCASATCAAGLCCAAPCGLWSLRFGDASDQEAAAVAVDSSGNVFVTGAFQGSADFGGGVLPSSGGDDIFLAKFDASGNHLWSKLFGDVKDQRAAAIAVDSAGNVAITGGFQGKVNFGGDPLTSAGGNDLFVAKFDPSGNHLWSHAFGDAGEQQGSSLAFSGSAVLVTGAFQGSLDFGVSKIVSAGGDDVFLAKLDAGGAAMWSLGYGDAADQRAAAVAPDGMGHLFLTGSFQGTINFGALSDLTSAGGDDIFVAELDEAALDAQMVGYLGSKAYGDAADQRAFGLAVDGSGAALITGSFQGQLDFGLTAALASAGGADVFVVKFDTIGKAAWASSYGDMADQVGFGIATDKSGDAILTGSLAGSANFGGATLTSAGGADLFVVKLDSTGKHLSSKAFGSAGDQAGAGIAADGSGNVLLAGSFAGSINLGQGSLMSAGGKDALLAKLAP